MRHIAKAQGHIFEGIADFKQSVEVAQSITAASGDIKSLVAQALQAASASIGSGSSMFSAGGASGSSPSIGGSRILTELDLASPTITIELTGDVSGTGSTTLENLANGTISIETNVDFTDGVQSFNARTGPVVLLSSDVTDALTYTPLSNTSQLFGNNVIGTVPLANVATTALSSNNSAYLNGQLPSFYMDLVNATGILPAARLSGTYTITATQANNSTYLNGETAAYYRNYNNLTNVPTTFTPSSHTHPISDIVNLQSTLDSKQNSLGYTAENISNKNAVNGYAGLDAGGKLLTSVLPDMAISNTSVVASQAAMLALTAQIGDVAIRTDESKTYILSSNSPTTLADWKELLSPAAPVLSVAGLTGNISAVNLKTALALAISDTSGLQTALNAKANLSGAVFTGGISVRADPSYGSVALTTGTASLPGYVEFFAPGGTRRGYIGYGSGSNLLIHSDSGYNWNFTQRPLFNGATPWDSNNFDPTTKQGIDAGLTSIAALTGAGVVTATTTDTFVMRSIGVSNATDILDRASADTRYALSSAAGVSSFNTRTGAITLTSGDVTGALGYTPWHAGNDGAGSGLDADTVDGIQANAFGLIGSTNAWTGTQVFVSGNAISLRNDSAYIDWYNSAQTTRRAYVQHTGAAWTFVNEVSAVPINFNTTGGGTVLVNGSLVWHAGNDGVGSGLDADLLDGQQGSYYANLGTNNFTGQQWVNTSGTQILAGSGNGYVMMGQRQSATESVALVGVGYSSISLQLGYGVKSSSSSASFVSSYSGALPRAIIDVTGDIKFFTSGSQTVAVGSAISMTERMRIGSDGAVTIAGSTVWHAGNDGAASGLDADLLDGLNTGTASSGSTIVARNGSGLIDAHSYTVVAGAGNGLRLWDGSTSYSIYMSDAGNATWGLRPTTETTSDYNMYFQMAGGGTNRGWVFRNNGSVVGGLDGAGNFRNSGFTKSKNGLADLGGNLGGTLSCRYSLPGGASYQTQAASVTGAIKIRLPRKGSSAMMKMRVEVFNYSTSGSKSFTISAYPFDAGGGVTNWVNITAEQYGENSPPLNVRFGHDGTYDCIWIGETSTVWQYPQVFITDFMHGYSGHSDQWTNNWAVTMETSFNTVTAGPRLCSVFWNSFNDGVGSGLDADTVDGFDTSQNSDTVNTIAVRDGSGYLNQRVIRNGVGGTQDGMYIGYQNASSGTTRIYGGGSTNASVRVNATDVTWFNGSVERRLWYSGGIQTAQWHASAEGYDRFYFTPSAESYYRGSAHYWYNTASSTMMVLTGSGDLAVTGGVTAATVSATSDRRRKKSIIPLGNASKIVDEMLPSRFTWKKTNKKSIGFIAQDLQKILPEAIQTAEDGTLSVEHLPVIAVLTRSLQETRAEIKELRTLVERLTNGPS